MIAVLQQLNNQHITGMPFQQKEKNIRGHEKNALPSQARSIKREKNKLTAKCQCLQSTILCQSCNYAIFESCPKGTHSHERQIKL
jgi:hypothetical protein